MRRKDRQKDENFSLEVIDESPFGTVAFWDGEKPYSLPLSIVRKDKVLYFHCAKEGKKVEIIKKFPKVSLSFCSYVKTPEELKRPLLSCAFTTEYKSAVVEGVIEEVTDKEEKRDALWLLCKKYTPYAMDFVDEGIEEGLSYTAVYRMHIQTITGKGKIIEA